MDSEIIIAKSQILISTWLESVFSLFSIQSPWFGLSWWQVYVGVAVIVLSLWILRHFLSLGWRQVDSSITKRADNKTKTSKSSKSSKTSKTKSKE